MKRVKDYMRREVVFLDPDLSIYEAAKILSQKKIAGAPVVDRGQVIGVLSISDVVKFMSLQLANPEIVLEEPHLLSVLLLKIVKEHVDFKKQITKISKTKVRDMMSKDVVAVDPDTNLFEAANMMEKHSVNRLPVIKNGKLVGIITGADLVKALIE